MSTIKIIKFIKLINGSSITDKRGLLQNRSAEMLKR